MLKKALLITLIVQLSLFQFAYGDMFTPSHSCSKPYKPIEFESEWEYRNFMDEVEDYKDCIDEFIEEQNEAIRKHQEAIEDAIDEWNHFVNYELD